MRGFDGSVLGRMGCIVTTIWKYPIEPADVQTLRVPAGARPLAVQTQNGSPQLWMLVEPAMPLTDISVRVAGTGHERDDLWASEYVGTFQTGPLVFHVFASDAVPA